MFGRRKDNDKDEYEEYENPYLSARKEYGDRYGAAVDEAARWRQISFFLLMLSLAFGAMMIWQSVQNKVVPYVVQVDKQGYTVAIKPATEVSNTDVRVITATLSRFFTNFKTVVTDNFAQRQMVDEVYNYLASGSSADNIVTHYYQEHNPFKVVNRNTTQVEVDSVLGIGEGGKSWQVLWVEKHYQAGDLVDTTQWRAIVTISFSPVQELSGIIKNPLGIYVTELNMAQDVIQ